MAISQEQIQQFRRRQFPNSVVLSSLSEDPIIRKGNEALVIKTTSGSALKWYAKLSGKSQQAQLEYAAGINQDEALLRKLGLSSKQLPDSHFLIGAYDQNPELFAIQPWIEGTLLKDLSLKEILINKPLRQSLADLFLLAREFNKITGRFPDLKGSEKLFGVSDPTKIIWPFRSTNIIVSDNTAVLTDARALNPKPGTVKYGASKLHQAISVFTAQSLLNR